MFRHVAVFRKMSVLSVAVGAAIVAGYGCRSDSFVVGEETAVRSTGSLFGQGVVQYQYVYGGDLSTIEGIAESVAEIALKLPNNQLGGRCTGVLVARNKVLTTYKCVVDVWNFPNFHRPEDLFVSFPQIFSSPGTPVWFQVEDVWRWEGEPESLYFSSRGLAVLTLPVEIAQVDVWQTPPVYLGDVEAALWEGTLRADDAIVAGFGPGCHSCSNSGIRRLGPLGNPVRFRDDSFIWGLEPVLESLVETGDSPGAEFTTDWLDRGGPLFLRETLSNRYVLVGTFIEGYTVNGRRTYEFTYLGRAGNGNPEFDHAEIIRPHLGDFVDGTPCRPSEYLAGPNSNFEAEMDLERRFGGMEFLADQCDPVPLMVFEKPWSQVHKSSKMSFSVRPWIGNGAVAPASYESPVSRFCDCFDLNMNPLDEAECLAKRCFAGEIAKGTGQWKGIDLTWTGENGGIAFVPAEHSAPSVQVREGKLGPKENFEWAWTRDVPGRIRGKSNQGFPWTQGYIGVALHSLGNSRSVRDDAWEHDLRGTVTFLQLKMTPSGPPSLSPAPTGFRCLYPGCLMKANARDFDVDGLRGMPWWVPGPPPHVVTPDDLGRFLVLRGEGLAEDITSTLGPLLQELEKKRASGQQVRWLQAVESVDLLVSLGISERAAALTPEGKFFTVASTNTGLEAVPAGGWSRAGTAAPTTSQSAEAMYDFLAATPTLPHAPPVDERAVYSAIEGAVYLVGGSNNGEKGTIRRTAMDTAQTEILSFSGVAPVGMVLGAAYAPQTSRLFVLDAYEGLARLTIYDVAKLGSYVLWTAPFAGAYEFVSLSGAANGELILVAGTESAYTAWLIQEKSNGLPAFMGRVDRKGSPVDEPAMGAFAPVLPVRSSDGELRYDNLDPREFENGQPCDVL